MKYFKKIKLKNNLDAYIIKLPHPSKVVYLDIIFENAIFYEKEKQIGSAHFLEHYLASFINKKFKKEIEIQGETRHQGMRLLFDIKSRGFEKKLEEILKIFIAPLEIDEEILEKEKKILIDELTNIETDTEKQLINLGRKTFIKSPERLKHPVGGYPAHIKRISGKDLTDFLKTLLANRTLKILIGIDKRKDTSSIESIIKKYLENIKLLKKPFSVSKVIYNKKSILIKNWPYEKKIYILLNFPGPSLFDAIKDFYAYGAFCRLFTGDRDYGVFKYLSDAGIYYGLKWYRKSFPGGGVVSFFTKTTYENFWVALKIIIAHFKTFRTKVIPKNKIKESFDIKDIKDSWSTNPHFYNWVLSDLLTSGKIITPSETVKIINSLDNKDIQKIANNFKLKNCSIVILGPKVERLIKVDELKDYLESLK